MSGRLVLIDNKEGISPRDCSETVTPLPGLFVDRYYK